MGKRAHAELVRALLTLLRAMDRTPVDQYTAAPILGCQPRQAARWLAALASQQLVRRLPGTSRPGPGGHSAQFVATVRILKRK